MIVSLLVAMEMEYGIGNLGRVPWHLGSDLKLFKILTMDHHIVMGRKTYESLGQPLPGRKNLLLTRDKSYDARDIMKVYSLENALKFAESHQEDELFIIGGGEVFSQAISLAHRIYLTYVLAYIPCDVFFPRFKQHEWIGLETGYHPADAKNDHEFIFQRLEK